MADNDDYNDEYQFTDLDAVSPDPSDDNQNLGETEKVEEERRVAGSSNVTRNAIIVVALAILAMVLYKFLGSYFSERKLAAKNDTVMAPMPQPEPQPILQPQPAPPITQPEPSVPAVTPQVEQKIAALELGQQSVRSDVTAVNNQLGSLSSDVNALSAQITQLNQTISTLSSKVNEQSVEIERLVIIRRPKVIKHHVVKKVVKYPKYYIQAVIPGRAWLISPNGATLTVREGTVISGYGTVKLIDPNQGRITTSSGQIIRFSQEDS